MYLRSTSARLWGGAAVCAGVMLCFAAVRAASDTTHQGVVKSIEDAKVVLTTTTKELSFSINASTQISLDGKPAKAQDVRIGDYASVTASAKAKQPAAAERIDAQRGSTPGTPDPVPQE